jgi:type VI secretion system secreted protein Hcp
MMRARTFLMLVAIGVASSATPRTASADGAPAAQAQAPYRLPVAPVAPVAPAQRNGPFLKFDGPTIAGDSTDPAHMGWIDVLSFSWGTPRPAAAGLGAAVGAAAARQPSALDIKKVLDKSSPALRQAAIAGTRVKTVVLELVHPTKHELYQVTMSDVLVSGISMSPMSAAGGERPTESLTLNFAKIEVKYQPAKPDGTLDTIRPVPAGWDLATNTKR